MRSKTGRASGLTPSSSTSWARASLHELLVARREDLLVAGSADEAAQQDAALGSPSRPFRRHERHAGERQVLNGRRQDAVPLEVERAVLCAEGHRDRCRRRARDGGEDVRRALVRAAQQLLRGPGLGGDDDRVALEGLAVPQGDPPRAVLGTRQACHHGARAHVLAAGRVRHGVGQVLQAPGEGAEERSSLMARLGRVLPTHLLDLLALCQEPLHERPVLLLHVEEVRVRRRQRHHGRVRAVHPAHQGLRQAIEALAAHAAHDEALERLVVALPLRDLFGGYDEVHAPSVPCRPRNRGPWWPSARPWSARTS